MMNCISKKNVYSMVKGVDVVVVYEGHLYEDKWGMKNAEQNVCEEILWASTKYQLIM